MTYSPTPSQVQYHRRDICVLPDTLVFGEMAEASDTLDLVNRNLAQSNLEIITHWIEPVGSTFRLVSDEEDNFVIEPESDHVMSISFAPLGRGDCLAVLNIISDDPDEDTVAVPLMGSALVVEDQFSSQPSALNLQPAYPNPFNAAMTIHYSLPAAAQVSLAIYDIHGREIEILVNERLGAGNYFLSWQPESLPSGLYFLKLNYCNIFQTRKLILIR